MSDLNEITLSLDNDIDLKLGDNLVLGNLDYINIGKIITSTLMSGIEASVSIKNRYDPSISRYVTDFDFKIPQGIKGDRGEQGIQGEKGDQGIQGIQGIQGEKGIKGDQGIQGEKGEKGDVGPKGTSVTGVSLNGLNFNFNFSDGTSKKVPLNTNDTATCTEINITNEVTQDSDDLVTSGAVYTAINTHSSNNSNPHNVTKEQVGLGNVDNTSDLDKPISTATQSALDEKLNTSNVVQETGTSETDVMSQKAVTEQLATKQDTLTAGDGITISNNTISASASGGLTKKSALLRSVLTNSDKLSTKAKLYKTSLGGVNIDTNIFKNSKGALYYLVTYGDFRLTDKDANRSYNLYSNYYHQSALPIHMEPDIYSSGSNYLCSSLKMSFIYSLNTIYDITINIWSVKDSMSHLEFLPIKVIKRVVDTSTGIITETQLPNCELELTNASADIEKIWYE